MIDDRFQRGEEMEFEDMVIGEVVVVAIYGKIMASADCVPPREKINAYLKSGKRNFVIDLAGVPWMNSDGIGLLAITTAAVAKAGGRLVLANINKKIERLLVITKCNTIIKHFDSRQAAVDFLSGAPDSA
jgi:anti-anti-sigma factor